MVTSFQDECIHGVCVCVCVRACVCVCVCMHVKKLSREIVLCDCVCSHTYVYVASVIQTIFSFLLKCIKVDLHILTFISPLSLRHIHKCEYSAAGAF